MKKITHYINIVIYTILLSLVAIGCAKQGYPSGGPKDTQPPIAGLAEPPSGTLNFAESSFYIPFDEYVVIKDAENNILISPPMTKKPEYVSKGRGLLVKIKDSLRANTTYLFQFKGAITDLNEGNALDSYEYAFSTGTVLDSMTFGGTVLDGLTLKPREETVSVMLYPASKPDSVVAKEPPLYITRCNKEGEFEFNNIAVGEYRILALEDGDRNMKLGDDEAMAFSDTLITAQLKLKPIISDSIQHDSTHKDTTQSTLAKQRIPASQPIVHHANLLMSKSNKETQRIIKSNFIREGRIMIISHRPMEHCKVEVMKCDTCIKDTIEWRLTPNKDTINIWTIRKECDSINIIVQDGEAMLDTLKLKWRKKSNAKKKISAQTPPLIKMQTGSTVAYFDSIWVSFDNPISSITNADSAVEVMNLKDSSIVHHGLRLSDDKLKGWIDMPLVQGEKYRLRILAKTIKDMYGQTNDTLTATTEVTKASQYGNLFINVGNDSLKLETPTVIIQLLSEDNKIIETRTIRSASKVAFEHLKPSKYKLRAIMDSNENGKWDGGDYWKKLQPEKIIYFPKTLDLRANWDMEERW